VRLLLDQNLSPRLVESLADVFPGSMHVRDIGMAHADDADVWAYAIEHDLVIASKDADFHQRCFLSAPPPKVVWIRLGNCQTRDVERILRESVAALQLFAEDPEAAFLALG
jgi:predicted nuclease of predicted toxin-antitoxin system